MYIAKKFTSYLLLIKILTNKNHKKYLTFYFKKVLLKERSFCIFSNQNLISYTQLILKKDYFNVLRCPSNNFR